MQIRTSYSHKSEIVFRWLILGCILIAVILVVGGVTRLTQSGLSMVKWEPIIGAIPPLNDQEWENSFQLYKQTPEFNTYNSDFSISDYKRIFFWEYLHRLIGRVVGLVFIIPAIYFWINGYFDSHLKRRVLIIFCWGLFQGVLGWFMVKSGLKDVPHVSHIRLAAHFVTAVTLILFIYHCALNLKYETSSAHLKLKKHIIILLSLLFLQMIYGAFVSGLKAGLMYNSFPKMNNSWLPTELLMILNREGFDSVIMNSGWVQFIHRWLPIGIFIYFILILRSSRKWNLGRIQKFGLELILVLFIIQILLGISTLILAVPIVLGVVHQLMALILILAVTFSLFTSRMKQNYD
ncbi:heme A synthase [bacterium]|nr:MAG: heme A synthase [bacterium]